MNARTFTLTGVIFIIADLIHGTISKIPLLGRFAADPYIRKDNFSFYFPLPP